MILPGKSLKILVLLIGSFALHGQQPQAELTGLSARPQGEEDATSAEYKKSRTSIPIPFFDDFSYRSGKPDPNLWADDHVDISRTMPASPPTIGAAVFDGLDRYGLPYDITNMGRDTCDVLTSQPIDLRNPGDSAYLSFFWQAGGHGEKPEPTDSLQLQFFDPATETWHSAWSMFGPDSTGFHQAMVYVPARFHQDGFRFRFTLYGTPAGAFDTWLIDYVRLFDNRTRNDTAFFDPAFTRPHPPIIQEYTALPWFHTDPTSLNFFFRDQLRMYYQRNLGPNNTLNPNLGVYRISLDGQILDQDLSGDVTLDPVRPNNVESTYAYAIDPSVSNLPNEEFSIDAFSSYSNAGPNRSINDTVRHSQEFKNYYAYDDGSAERAFQVGDNGNGIIVNLFELQAVTDPLMGLYIYFLPAEFDARLNEFTIVVYAEDANGRPGNLLYESDSIYIPEYTPTNFYLPYALEEGVNIPNNVFIGIRQLKNQRLPIGFDRNTRGLTTTFYGKNIPGQLFQSLIPGTLMMRPYFRYQPADLSRGERPVEEKPLAVYPNPARDGLHLDGLEPRDPRTYEIFDLRGRLMQKGEITPRIELPAHWAGGPYWLRISDPRGRYAPQSHQILLTR